MTGVLERVQPGHARPPDELRGSNSIYGVSHHLERRCRAEAGQPADPTTTWPTWTGVLSQHLEARTRQRPRQMAVSTARFHRSIWAGPRATATLSDLLERLAVFTCAAIRPRLIFAPDAWDGIAGGALRLLRRAIRPTRSGRCRGGGPRSHVGFPGCGASHDP